MREIQLCGISMLVYRLKSGQDINTFPFNLNVIPILNCFRGNLKTINSVFATFRDSRLACAS